MEASDSDRLDQAQRVLAHVLLRLPHVPGPEAGATLQRATADVDFDFERWPEATPVAAVGSDRERGTITVFLADAVALDGSAVARTLELDVPVDTVVSGPILPAAHSAQGGQSISGDGPGGDTGTITCLVVNPARQPLLLGCNHTLAGVNRAAVGTDTVRHPGAAAGGLAPADIVGPLADFEPIQLGGVNANVMDAAVGRPSDPRGALPGIDGIGAITGVGIAHHGDAVEKVGWRTGHTVGTYEYDIAYTTKFGGTPALFEQQMGIVGSGQQKRFAQQGDSGAPVLLRGSAQLVGMVVGVAAGIDLAIASPIRPILSRFDVWPMP
jgi:hypothetical protein